MSRVRASTRGRVVLVLGLRLGRAGCPYLRIISRVRASARVVLGLGVVLGLRLGPL